MANPFYLSLGPSEAAKRWQAMEGVIKAAQTLANGDTYGTSEHRSNHYALCRAVEALDA